MNPKGWKNHFFKSEPVVNDKNGTVWFKSACKLVSSATPTERKDPNGPVTCKRCIHTLEAEAQNG